MNRKVYLSLIVWILLASLVAASGPVEEVKVTPIVAEEAPTTLSLSALAERIRAGKIDVGEEHGMALDQRFHRIHAQAIEMECAQCHVQEAPYEIAQPSSAAPGHVDRRVCLGCHMNGPASKLYEPKE